MYTLGDIIINPDVLVVKTTYNIHTPIGVCISACTTTGYYRHNNNVLC